MWMIYAEASRPAATDVRSAVERLARSMEDLAFDASHEIVYGLGRSGLSEDELKNEEKQYNNGAVVCRLFLNESINRSELVNLMNGLRLQYHMDDVNKFIEREEDDAEQLREESAV